MRVDGERGTLTGCDPMKRRACQATATIQVTVIGQRYQVAVVEDWEASLGVGDDGSAVGHTYHAKLRMTLRSGQAPDYLRDTVLHEVMHAVSKLTDSGMEEDVVARVSTALLDALRHSPGLAEFLLDERA